MWRDLIWITRVGLWAHARAPGPGGRSDQTPRRLCGNRKAAHFSHRIAGGKAKWSSALRTDTFRSRDTPTSRPTQLRWNDRRGWTVATWRDWSQEHASAQRGTCLAFRPKRRDVAHPSTDTRTLIHPSASVFFAIRGPWHNGHDFLSAAHAKGVRRFVVSEPPKPGDPWHEGCDVLVVPDVLLALQRMARAKRTAFQGPVIAVTGSNGKTTVKEWLARLLPQHRAIHRSPLSHNSQLGVPLSMWSIEAHHDVSVIEAGISEPG